jgi:hypothetical protein
MTEFDAVKELQENIRNLFVAMSGPRQDAMSRHRRSFLDRTSLEWEADEKLARLAEAYEVQL